MDVPMFPKKVAQQLKALAQQCMDNPSLLHDPKLSCIKELIEHYGGKIPESEKSNQPDPTADECRAESKFEEPQSTAEPESESEESEESDLELDMTGVIGSYLCLCYIVQ